MFSVRLTLAGILLLATAALAAAQGPALKPQKCPICGQFHLTGAQVGAAVAEEQNKQLQKTLDGIGDISSQVGLGPNGSSVNAALSQLPASEHDAFKKALAAGDKGKLQKIFEANKVNGDDFLRRFDVAAASKALNDAVNSGAPAAEIEKKAAALKDLSSKPPFDTLLKSKELGPKLDTLVSQAQTRDTVVDLVSKLQPAHVVVPGEVIVVQGQKIGGVPVAPGVPVNDLPAEVAAARPAAGLLVLNPAKNGGPVSFTFDGQAVTIPAGSAQEIPAVASGVIAFDRGGAFGQAQYTLADGTYEFFASADKGWDIRAKKFAVTLDNTGSTQDFNFVADQQPGVVAAGKSLPMQAKRPVVLVFDQGDGGTPATKLLDEGSYKIGVDPTTKKLDIYRADPNATAAIPANRPPANSAPPAPPAPPAP